MNLIDIMLGTMLLAVIPFALAAYGGHVAADTIPDLRRRKSVRQWFWGMCIVGVLFAFLQQYRAARSDARKEAQIIELQRGNENLQAKLNDSILRQEFMTGQLSGLTSAVGRIDETGAGNRKQIASAIEKIAEFDTQQRDTRSALERMTNTTLRSSVMDYAKQLYKFAGDWEKAEEKSSDEIHDAIQKAGPSDRSITNKIWDQGTNRQMQMELQTAGAFREDYLANGNLYRSELVRRLGPQPARTGMDYPMALDGRPVTPLSISSSATYLQQLALKLPLP